MDTGLFQGAEAMRMTEKRLETITSNIANITASGFKRQANITRSFWVGSGSQKSLQLQTERVTDFRQGQISHTGNSLDLAIDGGGFFAIDTPTGRSYTRAGEFHLDNSGTLLNVNGFPVAWKGARGKLDPTGEPIVIDGSGAVRQGERRIGQLELVDFTDKRRLEDDVLGHYRPQPDMEALPATGTIQQGSIERSNVDITEELVEMVFAQRRFENSSSVMKSIDDSYKRLNAPRN